MNANADNHAENAELSPLEKLNGLIFDLGDTLPEGVYLEMMNHTKKIYDDMKKLKERRNNTGRTIYEVITDIIEKEDKTYFLRRVKKERDGDANILLFYGDDNLLFHKRALGINSILRLHAFHNNYKFMIIKKINEKSFKYDLVKITNGQETIGISRDKIFKFKDGEYFEDLRNKNIIFYENGAMITNALFNKLTEGKTEADYLECDLKLNELWN